MCPLHQAVTLLVRAAVTGIFQTPPRSPVSAATSNLDTKELCFGKPKAVEREITGFGLLTAKQTKTNRRGSRIVQQYTELMAYWAFF